MSIKQKLDDAVDTVAEKTKDAKDAVVDTACAVGDKTKAVAGKVQEKAQDATAAVGQTVKKVGQKIADQAD